MAEFIATVLDMSFQGPPHHGEITENSVTCDRVHGATVNCRSYQGPPSPPGIFYYKGDFALHMWHLSYIYLGYFVCVCVCVTICVGTLCYSFSFINQTDQGEGGIEEGGRD